jgi:tetratricopeptide (TPR) repeat protein
MAKKPKKISRKKLLKEPDEFITFSGKLIQFGRTYQKQLTIGFGTLFAILVIIAGVRYFTYKSEQKAFAALHKAKANYESILADTDPTEAYSKVKPEFQEIIDKYSRRQGGRLARIAYAHISYDSGAYPEAIVLYEDALDDFQGNPLLKHGILSGLGYSHAALNEDTTAIKYFEMIVDGPEQILKDEALFHLGALYEKNGNYTKSQEAFKAIVSDYPESLYVELAKEKTST